MGITAEDLDVTALEKSSMSSTEEESWENAAHDIEKTVIKQ